MNILFICDEYPPGPNGGIGSVIQNLARELVIQGHQVYVVGLYTYQYGELDYEVDKGVKIWRLRYGFNFGNNRIFYKLQRKAPSILKSVLYGSSDFVKFVDFIEKVIEVEKIDIIEQPDWNTYAYDIGISNPIFPKLKIPLTIKSHGSYSYFCKELQLPIIKEWGKIDQLIFLRADAISFVSKYCLEEDRTLFNFTVPTQILYNALPEINEADPLERSKNLVFFSGTLVSKKGVFSLMKAWNRVIALYPDARLVVFGKGEIEPLKSLLDNNAKNTVDFKGHQSRHILFEYLNIATLSIFPSYSETFGLGAVESMSCACPTIFTKRSCGPEIIQHNVNGLLVDPDNIEEIANNILLLLNDEHKRKELGQRGKAEVTNKFNLSFLAQQHITWYSEVIANFANGFKIGNS